jgi:hypothetical protein
MRLTILTEMKRYVPVLLLLAACTTEEPAHYAFVTTIGRDTISVENVTRRGNRLTSDEVERFPRVRRRHTTVDLDADGSIAKLAMDIHSPSEKPADRHAEATVSGGKVRISAKDGENTHNRTFDTGGSVAMAHVPQMYSLYELIFAQALKRAATSKADTVRFRQFYVDREFDNFPLHHGFVRIVAPGKAEIRHDWLSGIGEATFDSANHMLTYNGSRTTYDVRVQRVSDTLPVSAIADRYAAIEAHAGVKSLSVRDTLRQKIGDASFMIDYGRPLARGRELLGNVIRYGAVWRTGANAATQFSTSAPISLRGLKVPAGMYTLWTVPRADGADIIVNRQTGQWGTEYNPSMNLGRATLGTELASQSVEKFTFSIIPADSKHGTLVLEWGTFKWSAPITVER